MSGVSFDVATTTLYIANIKILLVFLLRYSHGILIIVLKLNYMLRLILLDYYPLMVSNQIPSKGERGTEMRIPIIFHNFTDMKNDQ